MRPHEPLETAMNSEFPQMKPDILHAESADAAGQDPIPASQGPIRVAVADDHPAVRLGVMGLIEDQPDMTVALEAGTAEEVIGVPEGSFDVAVIDYHLEGRRDGLWVARQLNRRPDAPRVLIFSAFADHALATAAIVAGADGLLGKTSLGVELTTAIRELASGRQYLPALPESTVELMASQLRRSDQTIFWMLLRGRAPEEISEQLGIEPEELDYRRAGMLLLLARFSGTAVGGAYSSLDYDRPNRHPRRRAI